MLIYIPFQTLFSLGHLRYFVAVVLVLFFVRESEISQRRAISVYKAGWWISYLLYRIFSTLIVKETQIEILFKIERFFCPFVCSTYFIYMLEVWGSPHVPWDIFSQRLPNSLNLKNVHIRKQSSKLIFETNELYKRKKIV